MPIHLLRTGAAVAAVTALLGTATVASATPAAAAPAPSCVAKYVDHDPEGFAVLLTNNCSTQKRVRVIVDWAPDSRCYTLAPRASELYVYDGTFGQYNSVATC
ncbi:hypothetical protein AR457_01540 [Streptomyces agglomeratus]|uniref:hypothetical protein n=1 Tax=Streptomyces agglomeratus TaxID=285458 RepID=UPI0008542290|nr:hypothetical protein [Streptomyces agglomeratus]OEJ42976.1 hypothetical protein AR457_01540 [Streptomyces agglomeratus]OEJ62464.1 hypothetical protein BGM19_35140 [Streptomyces agglomeratus]